MTSSVFDKESLEFLLGFDIPFVKIACLPALYPLIGEVPRKINVHASVTADWIEFPPHENITWFTCVRKYPADISDYITRSIYVSDHTVGWYLFRDWNPEKIEKHLCPAHEPDNPDSGPFAVTPEELREVIA